MYVIINVNDSCGGWEREGGGEDPSRAIIARVRQSARVRERSVSVR